MLIAYRNNDEVNRFLAVEMGRRFGAEVRNLPAKDRTADRKFEGVLYNLDDVPACGRGDTLSRILDAPTPRPRAVHGYGLTEREAEVLRLHGIAVAQRLQLDLVRLLCHAISRRWSSIPPDDALLDETWIDLRTYPVSPEPRSSLTPRG